MSSDTKRKMGRREADAHHQSNLQWWNDFVNENMIPEELKEKFRMSKHLFYSLCQEFRPYLQKQTTVFVEKQVASPIYYLSNEEKIEKSSKYIWNWQINCF